jgi:hypothetical protein
MVQLDLVLLHRARRLINGANVHRVWEMIFVYEQSVSLHNSGRPSHRQYQDQYENELRKFVATANLPRVT